MFARLRFLLLYEGCSKRLLRLDCVRDARTSPVFGCVRDIRKSHVFDCVRDAQMSPVVDCARDVRTSSAF